MYCTPKKVEQTQQLKYNAQHHNNNNNNNNNNKKDISSDFQLKTKRH